MTIDELTDEAFLARQDPELAALIVEWADWPCWRTMEAIQDWVFAQFEQALDRGELGIVEVQTLHRMIRKSARFYAERHPNPAVREWNRDLADDADRQAARHRAKAAERLRKLGYKMEQG